MSIGEILFYLFSAFVAIAYLSALIHFPYIAGQKSWNRLGDDERFNPAETPDRVFVRGTKGLAMWLVFFAVIMLIAANWIESEDDIVSFVASSYQLPLSIFGPMALIYLAGVYTAHLDARKRVKKANYLSSLSTEVQEKYIRLPIQGSVINDFRDIVIADLPVEFFFKEIMDQHGDIVLHYLNKFVAEVKDYTSIVISESELTERINTIFDIDEPAEALINVDKMDDMTGAVLQGAILYAIAAADNKIGIIDDVMYGETENETMVDFTAPLSKDEYCSYMLDEHCSISAIVTHLHDEWHPLLAAIGYMIMSNNDESHHKIYMKRLLS